jgi:hypothetical protein
MKLKATEVKAVQWISSSSTIQEKTQQDRYAEPITSYRTHRHIRTPFQCTLSSNNQGPPFGLCAFGCIRRGRHDHNTYSSEGGSNAAETSTVDRPFEPMTSIRPVTTTLPRGGSMGVEPRFFFMLCMNRASVTGFSSPRGTIEGSRGSAGEAEDSALASPSLPVLLELDAMGGVGKPFDNEPCEDTPGGFVPGPKCLSFVRSIRCALISETSGSIFGCNPKYSLTLFACISNWYLNEAQDALIVAMGMMVRQSRAYSFCETVLTDHAMNSSVISIPWTSYSWGGPSGKMISSQ